MSCYNSGRYGLSERTRLSILFGTVGAPANTPRTGSTAAIEYLAQSGLGALEIAWVRSVQISEAGCERIHQSAVQNKIALSVHAPYYINLNSRTDGLKKKSDARLIAAASKGALAGATDIIFHPGSYHGQPVDEVRRRASANLREITEHLHEQGVDVTLRPETMGKQAMYGSLEDVVALSAALAGVAPAIDVAHLHARPGDGSFNSYDEFAAMLEYIRAELGAEALASMHFHLSGIEYGPADEIRHLALEESDLNWRDFLQACIDYEVSGRILTESPLFEQDTLLVKQTYLANIEA